jgi:hypothetical protein
LKEDKMIGWKEALEGGELKKEHPAEYEEWLAGIVGPEGSLFEKEGRYRGKVPALPEQGFWAFKNGIESFENRAYSAGYEF